MATAESSKFVTLLYWVQHFNSMIFKDFKQFSWNFIISTGFVGSDAYKGLLDFTLQDVWL